jgi:adenosylmethionine-8-amino-7-oxononanoate aminotransferase
VYFTLGGSDAVDSAIRLVTNYFNALGKPQKKQFISLQRGYHGSSSTGAGLTAIAAFHANFDLPLPTQHYIPSPYPYRNAVGADPQAIIAASVKSLRDKVNELGADRVAAFFCEPIQGSGGVIVPPVGWLKAMRHACRELGILMVADEVITGFGRTGPMFACEAEGVEPDLMILAKGLTAGYAPMGAVMLSDAIYQAIADGTADGAPLGNGHTYSAHPVSAAIALEVLRLYEEGGLLANGIAQAPRFEKGLQDLKRHPLVGDARSRGLLGALELVADKATKKGFDPALRLADRTAEIAYRHGLVFRAFGDNILGFAPALCYGEREWDLMFERLEKILDEIAAIPEVRKAIGGQAPADAHSRASTQHGGAQLAGVSCCAAPPKRNCRFVTGPGKHFSARSRTVHSPLEVHPTGVSREKTKSPAPRTRTRLRGPRDVPDGRRAGRSPAGRRNDEGRPRPRCRPRRRAGPVARRARRSRSPRSVSTIAATWRSRTCPRPSRSSPARPCS